MRADVEALRERDGRRHRARPAGRRPGRPARGRRRRRWRSSPATTCPATAPSPPASSPASRPTADPALADWIRGNVSFVTTMVDRITPRTTADDVRAVAERTGWADAVPVVTEPFTEWVLSGDFPAGRPAWDAAGARFVDDVHPYETRKLLLLNGGHSLLAYAGSARGHDDVADAVARPGVPALAGAVVGRGVALRAAAGVRPGRLPRGAAGAVRQPPDPAHARADRRRRLPEGARSGSSPCCAASGPRAGCRPARCASWPPGSTTCAGSARR